VQVFEELVDRLLQVPPPPPPSLWPTEDVFGDFGASSGETCPTAAVLRRSGPLPPACRGRGNGADSSESVAMYDARVPDPCSETVVMYGQRMMHSAGQRMMVSVALVSV
jgi:hypothetical protein